MITFSGCEKVSLLIDYFSPKKSSAPTAQKTPSPVEPRSTPEAKASEEPADIPEADVLARVGDWTLTVQEFKRRLAALKKAVPQYDIEDPQQQRMVLEELVRQELLIQDAESRGLAQKEEIVKAVDEFKRTLLVREAAAKLTQDIEVTDEDAEEYYHQNKKDFTEPVESRVSEIVVDSEEKAKEILVELYKGADFEEMVRLHSKAKSAWQKGDLGYHTEFPFPKMKTVVSTLEPGDISSVFKGPEGFYIVKLVDRKGGKAKEFEDIRDEIKKGLKMLKQQQAIFQYLSGLQEKTQVEINDKLLEE